MAPLVSEDGWCDDSRDAAYNTQVRLPFAAGHERLWRDDGIYDAIVILGHNDDPPVPGAGSAIFVHLWRRPRWPTVGCIALRRPDLEWILARWRPASRLVIRERGGL